MTSAFATGSSRWARSAPARASGLCTGSDGRACISSMATLLCGSSLACVQTTPIACSRSSFASGDNDACARAGLVCEKADEQQTRSSDVKKISLKTCFIASPVAPDRFALFHECFYAFVRVLRFHQLVQVDVFLFVERGFDRSTATEIERLSRVCQRRARQFS